VSSERSPLVTAGPTPTTIRVHSGGSPARFSNIERFHSAPAMSPMNSPLSSCRPSGVPPWP
jgi:hypothetical protein